MISLDIDMHELQNAKRLLANIPYAFARAQKMAVRKSLEAMRAEAVRASQEIYYAKPSAIRKAIKLIPGNKGNGGQFLVRGKRLSVADFYMTPKRMPKRKKGLYVGVQRSSGITHLEHAFLISGKNSGKVLPFVRIGKQRMDIKHLTSPAVPQMMENLDVQLAITNRGEEVFMQSFRYWMQRAFTEFAKDGKISLPYNRVEGGLGYH